MLVRGAQANSVPSMRAGTLPVTLVQGQFPNEKPLQAPNSLGEEPMQLGRVRLTPEERQLRLRAGECLYCSQAGHLTQKTRLISSCGGTGESSSATPQSGLLIPATFCYQTLTLPVQALVDSGAEESFVDHDFITQCGVPFEPLAAPLTAKALNSRFLAHVTHCTIPVSLVLSGNHREEIQLCVISAPKSLT